MALLHKSIAKLKRTRGVWIVALATIALITLVGLLDRWLAYREIDHAVRSSLVRQVRLIEDRIGDQVRDINGILDALIAETIREGRCNPRLHERLATLYPEFRSIDLHDDQGVLRCSSRPELVARPPGDAIKAIKASPRDGILIVGRPLVDITGEPLMLFAKAKTDRSGRMLMAAVVSVDLEYYDRLLASLRDSDQGIFLAHDSGLLLSRLPDPQRHRQRDASAVKSAFSAHRESGQRLTVTRAVVAADQVERYVAIADVLPVHVGPAPAGRLIVGVSERVDKIFLYWWRHNWMFLGIGWLTALAILTMAFQVARRQLRLADESEQRQRTAAELAVVTSELAQRQGALDEHAIVSVADAGGNIRSVNEKFCAISGYARDELIGQNHRILNSGTHPPEFFREMWQTIASGRPWQGLICNRAKDGNFYWVSSSIAPIFDGAGKVDRYISIRTDVTPLVKAQIEIRKSERDFRSIFENLQDMFFRTDMDGRVTLVSPSVESLLQYRPDELVGRHLRDFRMDTDAPTDIYRQLERSGGKVVEHIAHFRRKDGQGVWVSTNAHYCHDMDGNIAGVEAIAHDITRRKLMNDALIAAKEAAEAANRAKSAFLSNMSHELRTPLNAVMGFSQLLLEAELAPDIRDDVDHIHKAGHHLLTLINEILDLSRIESGKMEIEMEAVDVGALMSEGLDLIGPLAARHGVSLDWRPPGETLAVQADRNRLKQAVLNLLSNAIKYNRPNGKVAIRVEPRPDGRVRIDVNDTGIGLSPEQLQTLFTPFIRMGPKNIEGTGIGLTITRRLVELMGGTIGVDSTPDVGSTFWIELDQARAAAPQKVAPTATAIADGTPTGSVLYIEDNPDNMQLMQKALKRLPRVELLTAPEPHLGLELARRHRPDLILLDINLPGIDGFEVLRRLRADATTRDIAVAAVSANAMTDHIKAATAAGFDDYVAKPFDIAALLTTVKRLLDARHPSRHDRASRK